MNRINYDKLIKAKENERELYKIASQIKRLQSGDIKTAEFLSGKKLLPIIDPVQEFLEREKAMKTFEPFQVLVEKNAQPEIAAETYALEPPHPNILKFFDEEDVRLLKEQEFDPNILLSENIHALAKPTIKRLGKENRRLNGMRNNNKNLSENEIKAITKKIKLNQTFRDAINAVKSQQVLQEGTGLLPRSSCQKVTKSIKERVKVLLGEIEAGNTSTELRNELSRLLLYLLKQKEISKDTFKSLSLYRA